MANILFSKVDELVKPLSTIDWTRLTFSRSLKLAKVSDSGGGDHVVFIMEDLGIAYTLNGIDEIKRFRDGLEGIITMLDHRQI